MRKTPFIVLPLILAACATTHINRQQTDRQLDMAIDGEGYFIVQTPAGGYLFTRRGAMQVSDPDATAPGGSIVNEDGYKLMGLTTVPVGTNNIIVAPDGSIRTQRKDQPAELEGQIVLARFEHPEKLDHDGVYFIPTEASGDPITAAPGRKGLGSLIVGTLEQP